MNIALFGPPGAGKGTQARLLQDSRQFTVISTGEILREEIQRGSPIGVQVKATVDAGNFPSEDIVLAVFEERLKREKGKSLILDGVPRTLYQAQVVDEIFSRLGICLDIVIQIAVDDEELVKRLSHRFICKTCSTSYTSELPPQKEGVCDKCGSSDFIRRPDDEPEAVQTRLDVYNERTKPLLQHYTQSGRLKMVDGMRPVTEVHAQIESLLEKASVDK